MPDRDRRIEHSGLVAPWFLISAAGLCVIGVLAATVWYWPEFNTWFGKTVAVVTTVFSFGALAALVVAFYASVLKPALATGRR